MMRWLMVTKVEPCYWSLSIKRIEAEGGADKPGPKRGRRDIVGGAPRWRICVPVPCLTLLYSDIFFPAVMLAVPLPATRRIHHLSSG